MAIVFPLVTIAFSPAATDRTNAWPTLKASARNGHDPTPTASLSANGYFFKQPVLRKRYAAFATSLRNSRRRIFPTFVFGSSLRNSTCAGTL